MGTIIEVGKWLLANWQGLLGAITAVFAALVVLASIIPGDQPDKTLKAIVAWLSKFSIKKK